MVQALVKVLTLNIGFLHGCLELNFTVLRYLAKSVNEASKEYSNSCILVGMTISFSS